MLTSIVFGLALTVVIVGVVPATLAATPGIFSVNQKSKFRSRTLPTRRSSGPVDAVNSTRNKR